MLSANRIEPFYRSTAVFYSQFTKETIFYPNFQPVCYSPVVHFVIHIPLAVSGLKLTGRLFDQYNLPTDQLLLTAHIFILQWNAQGGFAAKLDHFLQVINFFSGYPNYIVHNLHLHL